MVIDDRRTPINRMRYAWLHFETNMAPSRINLIGWRAAGEDIEQSSIPLCAVL